MCSHWSNEGKPLLPTRKDQRLEQPFDLGSFVGWMIDECLFNKPNKMQIENEEKKKKKKKRAGERKREKKSEERRGEEREKNVCERKEASHWRQWTTGATLHRNGIISITIYHREIRQVSWWANQSYPIATHGAAFLIRVTNTLLAWVIKLESIRPQIAIERVINLNDDVPVVISSVQSFILGRTRFNITFVLRWGHLLAASLSFSSSVRMRDCDYPTELM